MKLLHSPSSPYARKVYACALALGFADRVEVVPTNPQTSPDELLALNPLCKIPCLVTDDGEAFFDSPESGPARFKALKLQALADGIMDAAVSRRMEMGRPTEAAREELKARYKVAVARSLDVLEESNLTQEPTIGTIAVACALGYLTLRFSDEPWREGHPKLTKWFSQFGLVPCIAQTKPLAA